MKTTQSHFLQSVLLSLTASFMLFANPTFAQQANTEHTFKLDGDLRPAANIDQAAWLSGNWLGTAFGSSFEEVWNPPSANTMVGMFKVFDEKDGVSFYELMLIVEEHNSLTLKVKHFAADFTGWESKDDFVSFPLVKVDKQAIHFAGLSFYKTAKNKMIGYVAIGQKDGQPKEEKLTYVRRADKAINSVE